MENIKEFPCGILDQVISNKPATAAGERAPDLGPKLQAPSVKPEDLHAQNSNRFVEAASHKPQAPSTKVQASSRKRQAP